MPTTVSTGQLTIVDQNDGYTLTIIGGSRSFVYNAAGTSATPATAGTFGVTLQRGSTILTPSTYSWSTTGLLTGTATTSTFVPSVTPTYDVSNATSISVTVTYLGEQISATIPIAISKVGDAGAPGVSSIILIYTNDSLTVPVNSSNIATWTASGGDLQVYEGGTALTYTTGTATAGQYTLSFTKRSGDTLTTPTITGNGTTTATLGAWSGTLTTATAYRITASGKRADGSSFTANTDVTISPSVAGTDSTIYFISLSSPVIYKQAPDAATSGVHSQVVASGKRTTGSTTVDFGFLTIAGNGDPEPLTATATPGTLAPLDNAGKTKYTVKLYDTSAKTTLLDTQEVFVIFRGASGVDGISALSLVYTNDSLTVPVSSGTATWTGSGGQLELYEGTTLLTLNSTVLSTSTTGLANSQYVLDIQKISGDTLTVPSLTGTTTITVGNWAGTLTTATVYRITANGKRANGQTFTVSVDVSISPSLAGANATAYWLVSTALAVQKSTTATYTPSSLTFNLKSSTGTGDPVDTLTKFKVETSPDGTNYTQYYLTTGFETSYTYPIQANVKTIKVTALTAGSVTIDQLVIPVVNDGTNGTNGKVFRILPDKLVFTVNGNNSFDPASQTITFNTQKLNVSGTVSWVTTPGTVSLSATTGDTVTLTSANFSTNTSVEVSATADGITDKVTIVRVRNGSDTINVVLTNETHAVPTDENGNNPTFTGSGTTIIVYQGATKLQYDATGTTAGTWTITSVTATSITAGTPSTSLTDRVYGPITAIAADTGSLAFNISGTLTTGQTFAITKLQTFNKNKRGTAGSAATVLIGTVSTGAAGTSASVNNSGSSSAAILNFTIPQGNIGTTGNTGSSTYRLYFKGTTTPGPLANSTTGSNANIIGTNTSWAITPYSTFATGEKQWQADGTAPAFATGGSATITWGSPYESYFKVGSLSAITTDTGTLTIGASGYIVGGKTGYTDDTNSGFFLGSHSSLYKFKIGSTTRYLDWDGSNFRILCAPTGETFVSSSNAAVYLDPVNGSLFRSVGTGISAVKGLSIHGGGSYGVEGGANSTIGVYGYCNSGGIGVKGVASSGYGVEAVGNSIGLNASANATIGYGVYSVASGYGGIGVYGRSNGGDGFGLIGYATAAGGYGLKAESTNYVGAYIISANSSPPLRLSVTTGSLPSAGIFGGSLCVYNQKLWFMPTDSGTWREVSLI